MYFVPRIAKFTVVSLAVAGFFAPVFARGISPGDGGTVSLPPSLLSPSQDALDRLSSPNGYSGYDGLEQKFGVHDGRLDFFLLRPDSSNGFTPLLRGGVGDGGLQLQLKW